ncbi:hypothetical protein FLP10_01495 [Agromyces intestinalis]|uniref:PH domain-containing protein n=1 Tax=Agromyces intestinalis TaxID=2592652 RepID=A0A5C1YCY6_9MICO|nr:hypothetical protein [Agromyces intestinalis]QEO13235.1 hypothetical protein FLP10_01495 [Agromyces intestinalis]
MPELRIYESIARLVVRRPAVETGGSGFSYHRPVLTVLVVFIVLSAVEIPFIDLIVHRWPAVRIGFLVLGIWGLTWMVGFLAAFLVRPHAVGPTGIRVRSGLEIDVPLGWDEIASVAVDHRVDEPKSPRFVGGDDGSDATRTLVLRMQDATNVEIVLERPTAVTLPGRAPRGGTQVVGAVQFWTDDPRGLLAAVRPYLMEE